MISEESRWWAAVEEELAEIEEFAPIVPYEESIYYKDMLRRQSSPMRVCFDLDVRVDVIIDMLENSRMNIPYIMKLAEKLKIKCAHRYDLEKRINNAIADRKVKEEARLKELEAMIDIKPRGRHDER
jgi:hypothetical protein